MKFQSENRIVTRYTPPRAPPCVVRKPIRVYEDIERSIPIREMFSQSSIPRDPTARSGKILASSDRSKFAPGGDAGESLECLSHEKRTVGRVCRAKKEIGIKGIAGVQEE